MATRSADVKVPPRVRGFPQLRFMGSKYRLLPWIHGLLSELEFSTALDAFSGSGSVGYLMKAMGKAVTSNDRLHFSHAVATATVENSSERLSAEDVLLLQEPNARADDFIQRTFGGIFFTPADLEFLDLVWANLQRLESPYKRALVISSLVRACVKRQPRGVFTVAGDPERYKDGRRDLRLSLREHFTEHAALYSAAVFDNRQVNRAVCGDVFALDGENFDLVYLDPPYVPRADDNCYIKRYHFLEGLATYWRGAELVERSRVKKLKKPYTPFSYRKDAEAAFDRLFRQFAGSTIVLSYSSNGFPDSSLLQKLLRVYKKQIDVYETPYRYRFGTHATVNRNATVEYLLVGRD